MEKGRASPRCSVQGSAAPTPLCPTWHGKSTLFLLPVSPQSVPDGRGGPRPTAGHLDRHSDPRAAGTGAEIKRRPLPLHVAVGALFPYEFHYCKLKLTAPIEYYQVLPEQPVVPFLALTTLSLMRQMHCRDFSPAQAASAPVSPSTPAANLMLPPAPAPSLPARGAGSSA